MYEFFSYAYVSAISACVVLIIMLLFTDTVDKNHGRAKIYLFILLGMSILQGVAHILLASPFTTGNIELLHIYPMTSFGLKTMLAYFILLSVMNVLELKKKVIFKAYLLPLSLTLLYGVLYFICEDVSVRNLEGLATLNVMVNIRVLIFLTLMILSRQSSGLLSAILRGSVVLSTRQSKMMMNVLNTREIGSM